MENKIVAKFILDDTLVIRDNANSLTTVYIDTSDGTTYLLGEGFICNLGWVRPVEGILNDPIPANVIVLIDVKD